MPSETTSSASTRRRRLSDRRFAFPAIILLAAILTLYGLGAAQVCGFNEAVEGVALQQMVEHGKLLFPLQNGRFPMYKPPLFHWTAAALDRAAGIRRVTEFNLRLPAALYAIAGVALTVAFASSFLGPDGAVIAGLILCGSYQYIENARIGRVDMTLALCETLAIFSFAWWLAPRAGVTGSAADAAPAADAASAADGACTVAPPTD
jgi:4-amino-4-deoxy-L-arabinose transferase-like glycosyltransferase